MPRPTLDLAFLNSTPSFVAVVAPVSTCVSPPHNPYLQVGFVTVCVVWLVFFFKLARVSPICGQPRNLI